MNTWKSIVLANIWSFFTQLFTIYHVLLIQRVSFWYFYDHSMFYEGALVIFVYVFFLPNARQGLEGRGP